MASLPSPSVPVSWGELLDKITILEIKRERIARAEAQANVAREHQALSDIGAGVIGQQAIAPLFGQLKSINRELWEIEDAIRQEEAAASFGSDFIQLARSVYFKNDERARLKRAINLALESDLIEEKSYAAMR